MILIGCATTFGIAVPVGFNIGVINNPADLIKDWISVTIMDRTEIILSDYSLDLLWSTVVSIFLVGGAIGSFLGAWVADKLGRYLFTVHLKLNIMIIVI